VRQGVLENRAVIAVVVRALRLRLLRRRLLLGAAARAPPEKAKQPPGLV
jgi:hypothetical protein